MAFSFLSSEFLHINVNHCCNTFHYCSEVCKHAVILIAFPGVLAQVCSTDSAGEKQFKTTCQPRDFLAMILSFPLPSSSLSFLARIIPVFIGFLSPVRTKCLVQPTLNYPKLLLKVPCHPWGENAFFCCLCLFGVSPAQIIGDREWGLHVALALGGLSVLAEPGLADIATFGRHPLQDSLAF